MNAPVYPPIETPTMMVFERSDEIAAFSKAWPQAQKAMGTVLKDKTNPAFRSKYADLGSVMDAVVPALNDNGFGLMQFVSYEPITKAAICRTEISHESGEWKAAVTTIPVSKIDAQGVGSAFTYARRYSLQGACGVAPEDDDGNAAVGHAPVDGARKSSAAAKRDGDWGRMTGEIAACRTAPALIEWGRENAAAIAALPSKWQAELREEFGSKLDELKGDERREREMADLGEGVGAV